MQNGIVSAGDICIGIVDVLLSGNTIFTDTVQELKIAVHKSMLLSMIM